MKKQFNSVLKNHDLFDGFYKDGLLVLEQTDNISNTYVIGLDFSYVYHEYITFTILKIKQNIISSNYTALFGNKVKEINLMLFDILEYKFEGTSNRYLSLIKLLNIRKIPKFDHKDVEKILIKP